MSHRTRRSTRTIAAAATLVLTAATSAFALWPSNLPHQPQLYVIQGYLDRAPENAAIMDRIGIEAHGKRRTLLVTWYGTPGETGLDRYLSRSMAQPFSVNGTKDDVRRLIEAPPGTRVDGTFVAYTDGPPSLLIADLSSPSL
jgi:hypothetical protein